MAVYELRTYDIVPGKMANIEVRFGDHTLGIFGRHGINVIGFWRRDTPEGGQLIYICKFDQEADVKPAWDSFRADPEWQRVRAESEANGPIVRQVTSVLMNPVPYFPAL